ncbi:MAG: GDSL-type esterase/lipase family protein [Planctomycetaceae bacterium]
MNWLIYHIASGSAFFTGIALTISALALALLPQRLANRFSTLLYLIGVILIAISGTPLPYWYYGLAALVSLAWLAVADREKRKRLTVRLSVACAIVWLVGVGMELPFHFQAKLEPTSHRTVTIFGDSVTAGYGENEAETWPNLLAKAHAIEIRDHSHMGATAASALRLVRKNEIAPGVIIIEIGGNDLLGSTQTADFARDLDALLGELASPERQLVMFELPLPPFKNEWGQAQRRLAKRHGVHLIPKRVFMRVLTADSATLDSIHLSQRGQDLMQENVWNVLKPAFD